jgi:DNA topoisomerase I
MARKKEMKKLIIVESPAKIKTIKKFLGPDFVIMSTMGHIKDLPSKKIGVTMNKTISIDYEILEGKEKTVADICKAGKNAGEIFLAPDPDREGEIIAYHAKQELDKVVSNKTQIFRITFNEITKSAIVEAIAHPGIIDDLKVATQQARRVLDRWVGYEVSPILWKKIKPGLSAGRVQSVALRLICDREKAIRAFVPEEYWSITGHFSAHDTSFAAQLVQIGTKKADIKTEEQAKKIVKEVKMESAVVDSVVDKTRSKNPYPPFMTSGLQQAAYNRLGFAVKRTMMIAQQLYEGIPLDDATTPVALITYMRTDSLRIADSALKQVRSYLQKKFSADYIPSKSNVYAKKGKAQDAHEAIRPVDVSITPEYVARFASPEHAKLYELIWRRFVSSQMTPAEYAQRQVSLKAGKYLFKATGSTLLFDGFLSVYAADEEKDDEDKVVLPKELSKSSQVALSKVEEKQHFTQAPSRYNEASLVKELEKEGIGRPSTYAAILNTITARAYTTLEKKRFMPTELGMAVTDLLIANVPKIMDIKFTALMEEDLDKIAHGEMERDTLLREFYKTFSADLEKFLGETKKTKKIIETSITCPECNKEKLVIRFSKLGEFLGCKAYPECTFTSNFTRNEQGEIVMVAEKPIELLEETCPECGKKLRKIVGKKGEFIACSGYPDCKYIKQNKAGFQCPMCKTGDIVQRVWKKGKFWGCLNYPQCKFAVFSEIIENPCPKCAWPFLMIKKGKTKTTISCANKECDYTHIEEGEGE